MCGCGGGHPKRSGIGLRYGRQTLESKLKIYQKLPFFRSFDLWSEFKRRSWEAKNNVLFDFDLVLAYKFWEDKVWSVALSQRTIFSTLWEKSGRKSTKTFAFRFRLRSTAKGDKCMHKRSKLVLNWMSTPMPKMISKTHPQDLHGSSLWTGMEIYWTRHSWTYTLTF